AVAGLDRHDLRAHLKDLGDEAGEQSHAESERGFGEEPSDENRHRDLARDNRGPTGEKRDGEKNGDEDAGEVGSALGAGQGDEDESSADARENQDERVEGPEVEPQLTGHRSKWK